jgi:hypothetical protein
MRDAAGRTGLLKNRRGAVIVVVGIMLVVLMGFAAFAIDIGATVSGKTDAQRAADAAALAAASAYLDAPLAARAELAEERGVDWGTRNRLMRQFITPDEVTIELVTNTAMALRVRATVRREEVSTFFAGIWGIRDRPIMAIAEAEVRNTNVADCLKPFALPDQEYGPHNYGELVKIWVVGGEDHVLVGFNDNEPPGLGNIKPFITNKCVDGQSAALGDELLWEKPGNTQDGQGGDGLGQVTNGMKELLKQDTDLVYNPITKSFNRDDWASSVRVGNVVLYDHDAFKDTGTNQIRVVNFARVYFSHDENQGANPNKPYTVWGRVFPVQAGPVAGDCEIDGCAPNAFPIRLVN